MKLFGLPLLPILVVGCTIGGQAPGEIPSPVPSALPTSQDALLTLSTRNPCLGQAMKVKVSGFTASQATLWLTADSAPFPRWAGGDPPYAVKLGEAELDAQGAAAFEFGLANRLGPLTTGGQHRAGAWPQLWRERNE